MKRLEEEGRSTSTYLTSKGYHTSSSHESRRRSDASFGRTAMFLVTFSSVLLALVPLVLLPNASHAFSSTPNQRVLLAASHQQPTSYYPSHPSKSWQRKSSLSSSLSMHMGHSHSHHHHDHGHSHSHSNKNHGNEVKQVLTKRQKKLKRRRRIGSIVFAALATVGIKLFHRRPVSKTDLLTFCITSAVLFLSDSIRRQFQRTIRTFQTLKDGFVRHSTPIAPPKEWFKSLFSFIPGMTNFDASKNEADSVTIFGGFMNLLLSSGKLFVGVTCHSAALIADAGHSLSDLFSDVITLWAVQVGRLPPDEDHPYGHGKFEAIGSLFLALTLLGTGISVGLGSNQKLLEILALQRSGQLSSSLVHTQVPSPPALVMAFISIVSKEWLFRITRTVGEKLKSQVVIANAWHHRSDAYSSVLALGAIGLAIYMPSMVAADAAAGVLVAGMICMTGAEILGESIKQLTDTTNEFLVKKVRIMAEAHSQDEEHDLEVKRVRARQVGSLALVDVAIGLPGALSSAETQKISDKLRRKLLQDIAHDVLDIEVHATTQEKKLFNPNGSSSHDEQMIIPTPPSAADVEAGVRDHIRASNPDVFDLVKSVTVKYDFNEDVNEDGTPSTSTILHPNVDLILSLDADSTVASASNVAHDLRKSIEQLDQIHKANIFLDLNTIQYDETATTTSAAKQPIS